MSTTRVARGSSYRSYSRSNSTSGGGSGMSSAENLPPRILARVAREVRDLHKNPPEGVRLVVDSETGIPGNLGEVLAELEGPQGTPYESKFFQLKLVLSADFPASPPRGFFLTKIYHPNVDMSAGAICVNTLKKDWTSETTFAHVLSIIRCLLIVPFPESSLNDEAGKLFMESYDEYAKRARLMADVHGRPRPFSAGESSSSTDVVVAERRGSVKSSSSENANQQEDDVADENPLATKRETISGGTDPLRSTSGNTTKSLSRKNCTSSVKSNAPKGDKKSKKKSLKRL